MKRGKTSWLAEWAEFWWLHWLPTSGGVVPKSLRFHLPRPGHPIPVPLQFKACVRNKIFWPEYRLLVKFEQGYKLSAMLINRHIWNDWCGGTSQRNAKGCTHLLHFNCLTINKTARSWHLLVRVRENEEWAGLRDRFSVLLYADFRHATRSGAYRLHLLFFVVLFLVCLGSNLKSGGLMCNYGFNIFCSFWLVVQENGWNMRRKRSHEVKPKRG